MGKIQIKKQKGEDGYTSFSLRIPLQLSEQINREFDSKKQKKNLEALQTLHFFVKFSIFILRLFTSSVII